MKSILKTLLTSVLLTVGMTHMAFAGPRVDIQTNKGQIIVELDEQKAPKTVENFLQYVKSGFYDGTIFHRVISGFMIQGGGLTANMVQKTTRAPIVNEGLNGLKNVTGSIAMARTSDPDSATAQFFINVANNDFLDATPAKAGYAVFGRVVKGMDVVMSISKVMTRYDVPVEPIIIQSISIEQPTASTPTTTIQ